MSVPILADNEALKLRLRQKFGIAEMSYYVEQVQKLFAEQNPPDWVLLYKLVDVLGPDVLFIRCFLWEGMPVRGYVHACHSLRLIEKVEKTDTNREETLVYALQGSLEQEYTGRLIQLAHASPEMNMKQYQTYLKRWFRCTIKGAYDLPRVYAAILRRQPSRTTYIDDNGFLLYINREVVDAISDATKKVVDGVVTEITLADVTGHV